MVVPFFGDNCSLLSPDRHSVRRAQLKRVLREISLYWIDYGPFGVRIATLLSGTACRTKRVLLKFGDFEVERLPNPIEPHVLLFQSQVGPDAVVAQVVE